MQVTCLVAIITFHFTITNIPVFFDVYGNPTVPLDTEFLKGNLEVLAERYLSLARQSLNGLCVLEKSGPLKRLKRLGGL